jgi:hypothetical protein
VRWEEKRELPSVLWRSVSATHASSLITRMIHTTKESRQMKRLLDALIAYWKIVVSMGDYALDRKKEAPRPRLPQAHRYHA